MANYWNLATFAFNGSSWNTLSLGGAPSEHDYGIFAWDPTSGMVVVASGAVVAGGTAGYSGTDVLSRPLAVLNITGPGSAEVGQTVSVQAGIVGGVPQRSISWNWG
ncbi:MAG: hypothetical protein ACREDE_06745, partial [Thermoplasmata archaeon]